MAAADRTPVQPLRIFLIKQIYRSDEDILKFGEIEASFPLAKALSFSGALHVRRQHDAEPKWVEFVRPHVHVQGALKGLYNAGTAAVLLINAANRKFAVTVGYGRNLLIPESWERDFGLKVVLNTVDPASLRSIDCRNFDELTLQTRKQASR
ncbi:MAG TPA: DUF6119 family protein, partial [Phycisphaerae bacterium]|nr:DUF6119 family protein [Phycisphaerae bacterium]